jgi:ferredoxin
MVDMSIREEACRGCQMCKEICPTDVIAFDDAAMKARVDNPLDCIACLSCAYLCPSFAIRHDNFHVVKNFYRDLEFSLRFEKFL